MNLHSKPLYLSVTLLFSEVAMAAGLGSQSWGGGLYDGVGSSRLGLLDAVPLLAIVAGCYWLAFSSKSPVAGKFFTRMFFFLFAPAICVTLFLAIKKMF